MVGKGSVVAPAGQLCKLGEHVIEEESQPDTLAAPLCAYQIHPVVPVAAPYERQAMLGEFEGVFDGVNAMLIQRGRRFGAIGQVIVRFLPRFEVAAFQKGNGLVEHAGVGDAVNVAAGGGSQPEEGIAEMRPDARAGGGG